MRNKIFKKESDFQHFIIDEIEKHLPGCIILKNDANYCQGIPDWIIIYKDKYAFLEVKKEEEAHHQPNQDYYINKISENGFAAFIFPENKDKVLSMMYTYLS